MKMQFGSRRMMVKSASALRLPAMCLPAMCLPAMCLAAMCLAATVFLVGSSQVWAQEEVSLKVWYPGGYDRVDRAVLSQLPVEIVDTSTPWDDAVATYRGVPVSAFAAHYGSDGASSLVLKAGNDYWIFSTVGEYADAGAILAFEKDGEAINTLQKGPFVIVFPWTTNPRLDSKRIHALAVWYIEEVWIGREPS